MSSVCSSVLPALFNKTITYTRDCVAILNSQLLVCLQPQFLANDHKDDTGLQAPLWKAPAQPQEHSTTPGSHQRQAMSQGAGGELEIGKYHLALLQLLRCLLGLPLLFLLVLLQEVARGVKPSPYPIL